MAFIEPEAFQALLELIFTQNLTRVRSGQSDFITGVMVPMEVAFRRH